MLSSVFTILALSAAGTFAAPVSTVSKSISSFTVPAVHNAAYVRNGTASLLKAYAKFGLKTTKPMPAGIARRQNGNVIATPAGGVEYLCQVDIGGQTLNLDFDTGSADL